MIATFERPRFWRALLLLSLLFSTACSFNPFQRATATPSETVALPTPTPDPAQTAEAITTLQLMGWPGTDAHDQQLQTLANDFALANPGLQITLTLVADYEARLQTALSSSTPPDVVYVDGFQLPALVADGALVPIGDQITNPDDFYPTLRAAFTINGSFYCPPQAFTTLGLLYNRALFDAAGVAYPTSEWRWEDLRAAAEKLTDKTNGISGLVLSADFSRWLAFLYQAGGAVTATDAATGETQVLINSTTAVEAMDFYGALVVDGFAAPPTDLDSLWAGEAFGKGKAAMAIEGNWMIPYLQTQAPSISYGVAELPMGPQSKVTIAFATCYAVPANAPNLAASLRLVDYLTSKAAMRALTAQGDAMPTRASLREEWLQTFPAQAPFLDGVAYARLWQLPPGFGELLPTINGGLAQVFAVMRNSADVLAEADGVAHGILAP